MFTSPAQQVQNTPTGEHFWEPTVLSVGRECKDCAHQVHHVLKSQFLPTLIHVMGTCQVHFSKLTFLLKSPLQICHMFTKTLVT